MERRHSDRPNLGVVSATGEPLTDGPILCPTCGQRITFGSWKDGRQLALTHGELAAYQLDADHFLTRLRVHLGHECRPPFAHDTVPRAKEVTALVAEQRALLHQLYDLLNGRA